MTALLQDDVDLARDLINSDADPWGLAWGALTIGAGLVKSHSACANRDPLELWSSALQTIQRGTAAT